MIANHFKTEEEFLEFIIQFFDPYKATGSLYYYVDKRNDLYFTVGNCYLVKPCGQYNPFNCVCHMHKEVLLNCSATKLNIFDEFVKVKSL